MYSSPPYLCGGHTHENIIVPVEHNYKGYLMIVVNHKYNIETWRSIWISN